MNSRQPCMDREKLFAYALRLLEGGEETKARAHVERCAACSAIVAEYQGLRRVLDDWKPAEPSPWFDARARARVASLPAASSASRFLWVSWRRWAIAAAVAILVTVGGITVYRSRISRTPPMVEARTEAPSHVATANAASPPGEGKPEAAATQEIDLYKNLHVLENYDMLANFDVLSELPHPSGKVSD